MLWSFFRFYHWMQFKGPGNGPTIKWTTNSREAGTKSGVGSPSGYNTSSSYVYIKADLKNDSAPSHTRWTTGSRGTSDGEGSKSNRRLQLEYFSPGGTGSHCPQLKLREHKFIAQLRVNYIPPTVRCGGPRESDGACTELLTI